MSKHSGIAVEYFKAGYSCAQSVLLAFGDVTGLDRQAAAKLASSFGAGMGRLREVCGALSGAFLVAGILYGYDDPHDAKSKAEHYALVQSIAEKFRNENGAIVCRELLGLRAGKYSPVPQERTPEYYRDRPCAELVECASQIIDEIIQKKS